MFLEKHPKNPFYPLYEHDRIIWKAKGPCDKNDVVQVLNFSRDCGRTRIVINTGGHGSMDGQGPHSDTQALGEVKFLMEDISSAQEIPGIFVFPHNVSEYSPPLYPDIKIDIIDAWCYSEKCTDYK